MRKFTSADTPARAQATAVQIPWINATIPQCPCCYQKQRQHRSPSRLSPNHEGMQRRSMSPMEPRDCCRLNRQLLSLKPMNFIDVTMPRRSSRIARNPFLPSLNLVITAWRNRGRKEPILPDAANCLNVRYSNAIQNPSWFCRLIGKSNLVVGEILDPKRFMAPQRQHVLSE